MVKVSSPASSANLGPGFDICGIALSGLECIVEMSESDGNSITSPNSSLPEKFLENEAKSIIEVMRKEFEVREKVEVKVNSAIQVSKGLGATGACCAGIATAFSELYCLKLPKEELVKYSSMGEAADSLDALKRLGSIERMAEEGVNHLDSVSPSLYGNFTLVTSFNPIKVRVMQFPKCDLILVVPEKSKASSDDARRLLPETVPRKLEVANRRCLAEFLYGIQNNDLEAVISGMEEFIVEPAREKAGILPNYYEVKKLAREYGFGAVVSGAGPSILVIAEEGCRKKISFLEEVRSLFKEKKMGFEFLETSVAEKGSRIID